MQPITTPVPVGRELKAYELILGQIHSGALKPGDLITETGKGFSQGSVRQALIRLEHAGLVVRRPHQTATVVNLTKTDLSHLIEVRAELEVLAWKQAQLRLREPQTIQQAHDLLLAIGGPSGDEAFHRFVWRLARNPWVTRTLNQLTAPMFAFVGLLRRTGMQDTNDRLRSHESLLRVAIEAHPDYLEKAVRDHIQQAYARFLESNFQDLRELAQSRHWDEAFSSSPFSAVGVSKHQDFLRGLPAIALVLDAQQRVIYANEGFERINRQTFKELRHRRLRDRFWLEVNDVVAREHSIVLAVQRAYGQHRMTLAFPIPEPASMIGEIGFDITPLLSSVDAQTPIAVQLSPVVVHGGMTNRADVAPEVFEAFFEALPAVATWKDPQGRLLWASPEYEWVTGKRIANVIGRSPVANWPGRSGEAILKRDAMVRDNRVPYLTTDLFEFDAKEKRRVTIRFPLLNDVGALDGTASLGLDHALLIHSARMLQELGEDGADFARFCDLGIAVRPVPPALPTRFPSLSD